MLLPGEGESAVAEGAVSLNMREEKPAKRQARRLLDKNLGEATESAEEEVTELDRERAERMRRNAEALAKIGVASALGDLRRTAMAPQPAVDIDGEERERRHVRPKRERAEVEPQRRSTRAAGAAAAQRIAETGGEDGGAAVPGGRGHGVMTQEEYLASKGLPLPEGSFSTDGRYRGWVAPGVAVKLGLAASAAEAWEQGGGGKFQRSVTAKDVPAHLKAKGMSNAKAFAASQLHKNPNSYFYRHTAPGQVQAAGEWTEEEHAAFVATARQHGVGDKWGLFASYLPQRVGYQCSQYYAQVIIPSGLILDSRFRMDSWGSAVFMGGRGGRGDD